MFHIVVVFGYMLFYLYDGEKPRKLQRGENFLSAIIVSQSSGGDGDAKVSKAISALHKTCANEQKNSPLAKRKI